MARYIDAEKFEDAIKGKEFFGGFFDNHFIYNELHRQPTAEVIPKDFLIRKEDKAYNRGYAEAKSEVEVQHKQYYFDAKKADESLDKLIANAKTEVAREIFEEIEKKIVGDIDMNNTVLIEFEDSNELYHRIKGEISALCDIQDFFAELKEKYVPQDCRDCKYFVGCECFSGMTCDMFKKECLSKE